MSVDKDRPHGRASRAGKDRPSTAIQEGTGRGAFASIEAEGTRERWQLARRTARAVFADPAAVTPRQVALLGEQGLAQFVEELRSATRLLIRREREKFTADQAADAVSPAPRVARRQATDPVRSPAPLGRPAAFGRAKPPSQPSYGAARLSSFRPGGSVRRFVTDVLNWSGFLAATLVGAVVVVRLFVVPFL
ncbi:hypothetical protein [Methylobacterium isbiliense]|uniref:hypothetical protein n=1 Tax=Methylobacterium isbiliense TaxID=315478 RepID=UPI0025B608FF|nr:hypothetical protein [Methylobacterium isbiliense]MDN3624870.1 hypothetical protein [Methylobacterium isbiliense]